MYAHELTAQLPLRELPLTWRTPDGQTWRHVHVERVERPTLDGDMTLEYVAHLEP